MFTFFQVGASCKWVDDSQHLVLEHFDTICNSPSQIYHSALPLCPSSSWFHKHYTAELSQEVKVVKGLPAGWGPCSRTVALDTIPLALTCWKDTITVGLGSGKVITLDGITGIQTAVHSGHTAAVNSLAFFSDGTSLVSGSFDRTIKLWDMQTGGVVKTFHGHTNSVESVSISADCTTIASGSTDNTTRLWDIQAEQCLHVIEQQNCVLHVRFSPTDPQHLTSVSGGKIWHWNIHGHQTNPAHNGSCIGTQFVSCYGEDIVVQNSSSGGIVAKFHGANSKIHICCISPDGRLIAIAVGRTAHVWDTTSSHLHPITTFVGHTMDITSLAFSSPSSLISSSWDKSVKFWKIGTLQSDLIVTDPESTPLTSAEVASITLQAEDGIVISSTLNGVVRTWDLSTGLCRASFQALVKCPKQRDVRLINSRLVLVWYEDRRVHIWDIEEGELLKMVEVNASIFDGVEGVWISGDGSNVLCLHELSIQARSIQTGEVVNEVGPVYRGTPRYLTVDGSRVWFHSPPLEPLGWDFGTPGSTPVQLSNSPLLLPNNAKLWDRQSRIRDAVTGRVVFQLAGKFAKPVKSQWDGCYLVTGYSSGEILILDFNHVHF